MARVHLRIEPEFLCDVASVGTVAHILVVRRMLGLGLGEAKELIDRCVFGGETVAIEVASHAAAQDLADALAALPGPARVEVTVEE